MALTDHVSPSPRVFTAFLAGPKRWQRLRLILLFLVALAAVIILPFVHVQRSDFKVITPGGPRRLDRGMSEGQVGQALGRPIASEQRDGMQCFEYGRPILDAEWFLIHTACFRDGKLAELTSRRQRAETIETAPLPEEG